MSVLDFVFHLFVPLPTYRCQRHYVSGFSVCECFCASVQALVLLAQYVTNQWMKFHQKLVDDLTEGTDELMRF